MQPTRIDLCAKSNGLHRIFFSVVSNGRLKGFNGSTPFVRPITWFDTSVLGLFISEKHVKKENRWSCADATRADTETKAAGWGYNTMPYGARWWTDGGGNEEQRFSSFLFFCCGARGAGLVIHSICCERFPANLQQRNLQILMQNANARGKSSTVTPDLKHNI